VTSHFTSYRLDQSTAQRSRTSFEHAHKPAYWINCLTISTNISHYLKDWYETLFETIRKNPKLLAVLVSSAAAGRGSTSTSSRLLLESDHFTNPPIIELFDYYNITLKQLVDRHVPVVTVTSYTRPTAPWFDQECSRVKTKTRRLEKIFRQKRDGASEWDWLKQFQLQRLFYSNKFTKYWTEKIRGMQQWLVNAVVSCLIYVVSFIQLMVLLNTWPTTLLISSQTRWNGYVRQPSMHQHRPSPNAQCQSHWRISSQWRQMKLWKCLKQRYKTVLVGSTADLARQEAV